MAAQMDVLADLDPVDFLGGTLSGAAGVVVGQPFDVVIVRIQTAGLFAIKCM